MNHLFLHFNFHFTLHLSLLLFHFKIKHLEKWRSKANASYGENKPFVRRFCSVNFQKDSPSSFILSAVQQNGSVIVSCKSAINSFQAYVLILCPLKTRENQRFFIVSRGYRTRSLAKNRLKASISLSWMCWVNFSHCC